MDAVLNECNHLACALQKECGMWVVGRINTCINTNL